MRKYDTEIHLTIYFKRSLEEGTAEVYKVVDTRQQ